MLVVQSAGSSPQGTENGCGQKISSNITRTVEEDANNDQFAHLRQDAQKGITDLGNLEVGVSVCAFQISLYVCAHDRIPFRYELYQQIGTFPDIFAGLCQNYIEQCQGQLVRACCPAGSSGKEGTIHMTKVLILEDKRQSRELLVRLVKEIDPGADVYALDNEEEAYVIAIKKNIDVFLVDIILHPEKTGDQSGAVFASNIRSIERYLFTPVIFITTLYDAKMSMFSTVQCYGFIEKPFDLEKTKKMIATAMRYHTTERREKTFIFHTDGLVGAVPVDDIIYLESRGHKLYVHTTRDNIVLPYRSCKRIMEEIDSDNFEMCNRGTVVNMSFIKRIDSPGRYLYLRGIENAIKIGPVLKKKFMERFRDR